jgi:alpha-L-rhamnosidase
MTRAHAWLAAATLGLAACASVDFTAGGGDEPQGPTSSAPGALRVEYADRPLGIDVAHPRLSWQLPTASAAQSAYRIRVATAADRLEAAPLWDSGQVSSSDSVLVPYAGPDLRSREHYWWQVQTWDGGGRASQWSAPSWWEMGLLAPDDWSAAWISGRQTLDHNWTDTKFSADFTLNGQALGFLFRARPVGKIYGESYLWKLTDETGQLKLVAQVRRYAGGSSSKIAVGSLRSVPIATDADWKKRRHRIMIDAQGSRIVTTLDGVVIDTLEDTRQTAGTVGFVAAEPAAAVIHAVTVEGVGSDKFETQFAGGANPFTGGSISADGLIVAAGVPEKDLVLPIGAPAPLLRRGFDLPEAVQRARLYVAAGGLPRISLNGAAIGEALADGYTDYGKRVLYRTYDVSHQLKQGANVIGVEIGRGWYGVTEPNEWYWHMAPWHAAPALRAQLEVTLASGKQVVIGSGADWRASDGPTLHDSVYGGERYDARKRPANWDRAGFDDSTWLAATAVRGPAGRLAAAMQEPIAVTGTLKPTAITTPKPGVHVFDFGGIVAGRARLSVKGEAGQTVTLIHGEKLNDDGTVQVASGLVDTQLQTHQYTLAGTGAETWAPSFSYQGFRYVQVENFPGAPTLTALTSELMNSASADAGSFDSSNDVLNRIQAAARRTLSNNRHGNQTDTPTLEKNGWTGDAQASALASILNFDVARVWTKWLADFRDSQSEKGEIPEIVPSTPYYGYENTPGWGAVWGPIPSWDAATFVLPWEMYQAYGDRRILEQMYETHKKLVDYTGKYFNASHAYNNPNNFLLGEYASVMPPGGIIAALRLQPNGPVDATASAYWYRMLDWMAQSAALLNRKDDEQRYRDLAAKVRAAYNARYWDAAAELYRMPAAAGETRPYAQTPNILAVAFGIVPDGKAAAVMLHLKNDILARGYHLGCGVYAGRYVMTLLGDYGYADTAYQVATRTDFPSWGFWIMNGLSTMAEGWELSSRSWDHHYWASVSSYFYQSLAGIRPTSPGYATVQIRPQPPAGLESARAHLDTLRGRIESAWRRNGEHFELEVKIPAGVDAEVWMPAGAGRPASAPAGAVFDRMDGDSAVYRAAAGAYRFRR